MKKHFLIFTILMTLSLLAMAQKKIALLEPRVGDGSTSVSGMEKAMVRGELRKAIVNHTGYEAFTRADIDKLMTEQDFQRTGMVSDDQIKKIGVMSGADYICVSTLNKTNTEFYLEAYLVNVESAQISNPASQYGELNGGKLANMLPVCQALAQELLGTISPAVRKINTQEGSSGFTQGIRQVKQNLAESRQNAKDARARREAEEEAEKTKRQAEESAREAEQEAEIARMMRNEKIGTVMTFPDGTRGVVFYAEGDVGLAMSMDFAEMKWQNTRKSKNLKDVLRIPNKHDKSFSAGLGLGYTQAICAELGSGEAPAAEWCTGHGNGWYLPSEGELVWMFKVYQDEQGGDRIDDALAREGGFPLDEGWYWSSSECEQTEAINVSSKCKLKGSCEDKDDECKVRAIRMFKF